MAEPPPQAPASELRLTMPKGGINSKEPEPIRGWQRGQKGCDFERRLAENSTSAILMARKD
jgi:hypothetical protein